MLEVPIFIYFYRKHTQNRTVHSYNALSDLVHNRPIFIYTGSFQTQIHLCPLGL